jgi:hypothetical protein
MTHRKPHETKKFHEINASGRCRVPLHTAQSRPEVYRGILLRPGELSHRSTAAERSDSSAFCSSRQRIGLSGNRSALRRAMRAVASRRSCVDPGGRVRSRTAVIEPPKKRHCCARKRSRFVFQLFTVCGGDQTIKRGAETQACRRANVRPYTTCLARPHRQRDEGSPHLPVLFGRANFTIAQRLQPLLLGTHTHLLQRGNARSAMGSGRPGEVSPSARRAGLVNPTSARQARALGTIGARAR